jgi:hypothetical protein
MHGASAQIKSFPDDTRSPAGIGARRNVQDPARSAALAFIDASTSRALGAYFLRMKQPELLRRVEEALSRSRALQQQADWQIKRAEKHAAHLLDIGEKKPPLSESAIPRQNGTKTL